MTASPQNLEEQLVARLAGALDQAVAADLAVELVRSGTAAMVLELLDELHTASAKVAQLALEALPELRRRGVLEAAVPWLDLGVALAGSSGAAAMKYFRESPLLLGLIESESNRHHALAVALELADRQANLALDFLRQAPELLTVLGPDGLSVWAEIGAELADYDYVLSIEFFRNSPAIARVIPLGLVRTWVGFGMKLVTRNSLGKTDYVGTLEFFRTSPALLGDLPEQTARKGVVDLGSALADREPHAAILLLAEAPALLRRMPSEDWRLRVLRYGLLIAERDAEAALAYLRRCPEIVDLLGGAAATQDKFEEWYRGGMEVLGYSIEGARAYFALETHKAMASIELAMSGVPLRQIARSLKLFAQGLCGTDVTIRSLPETPDESGTAPVRATVSADGRTIALPAVLRRYATREENVRLYHVMTAHEAGHLEFGTYHLPLGRLADLIELVRSRYRRSDVGSVHTLEQLFSLYPQPGLARDLWTVLEDARVENRLQLEYPGLRHDLAALAREAVTTRSLLHGLSVRELVVDALLLRSTAEPGTVRIPESIAGLVDRLWLQCRTILTPGATAEDVVRLVDHLYVAMEDMLASVPEATGEAGSEAEQGTGPKASEETAGIYRPVTNWMYRGAMNPDFVRDRQGTDEPGVSEQGRARSSQTSPQPAGSSPGDAESSPRRSPDERGEERIGDQMGSGRKPSAIEQMLAVADPSLTPEPLRLPSEGRVFLYDEWDGMIRDYRSGWCRIVERPASERAEDFAGATIAAHGPAVRLLRRYFESLRPPGLRRIPGQTDGEDLDLDAVVGRRADLAAGAEPSERIYVRREKRERDVAAVFLVDLSGSTSRQIESSGDRTRRVIDVEKEGLILLCEALEAVGDQYAVYGYSGQGRRQVDFLILKDFDEPAGRLAGGHIGALSPRQQNRDGAAIRHASRKLLAREARHRLLILLSDGKPLDDGYADEYSLEDTKMALREARMKGIEPFCITVDRTADDYLRRMYGEVRFLIIDRASALPERLPRLYRRLTA
jgi:nitric oxide reductase NorD protein